MKCHIDIISTLRSVALKEVFLPVCWLCHCQASLLLTLKSQGTATPVISSYLPSEEMVSHSRKKLKEPHHCHKEGGHRFKFLCFCGGFFFVYFCPKELFAPPAIENNSDFSKGLYQKRFYY